MSDPAEGRDQRQTYYGRTFSPQNFIQSSSQSGISGGELFIVDPASMQAEKSTIRACAMGSSFWFEIPIASMESITPVSPAFGSATSSPLTLVAIVFRVEFKSLADTFRSFSAYAQSQNGIGYSGNRALSQEILQTRKQAGLIASQLDNVPEPCPASEDNFLGIPGSFLESPPPTPVPPAGTFVRIRANLLEVGPHKVLVKQGSRVIARFYLDLVSLRQSEAAFISDGNDIKFEFEQCFEFQDGSHDWRPLVNYILDQTNGDNHSVLCRTNNLQTNFVVEWGPNVVPPAPPAYLQVGGEVRCGGFIWKVASSFARAWTTSTPDPNGPRVPVKSISVGLNIQCRQFSTSKTTNDADFAEASETFRGAGVPVCCDIIVSATAVTYDGKSLSKTTNVHAP